MITVADALEVMAIVTACHHRTAPRMDDDEVAYATAEVWSELFDGFDFSTAELVAAVKARAKICPDAPEAADIIRVARANRSDRMARESLPEITSGDNNWDGHYPGDAEAAPDIADYPPEWTSEQRVSTYWYAIRMRATPSTTTGWRALAEQLAEHHAKRTESGAA